MNDYDGAAGEENTEEPNVEEVSADYKWYVLAEFAVYQIIYMAWILIAAYAILKAIELLTALFGSY